MGSTDLHSIPDLNEPSGNNTVVMHESGTNESWYSPCQRAARRSTRDQKGEWIKKSRRAKDACERGDGESRLVAIIAQS